MKKAVAFASSLLLVGGVLTGCGSSSTSGEAEVSNALEAVIASGELVVATSPDYAPSEFLDPSKSGQEAIVGADISLAYYIAEELGVELKIEQMDFDTCIGAVSSEKVDISISGFSATEEREKNMECSDLYYWDGEESGHGLLILDDSEGFSQAEELSGLTVAAQSGSLQYDLALAQLPEDVNIELVKNLSDGVQMLMSGKVDAVSYQYAQGLQYAENYEGLAMAEFMYDMDDEGNVVIAKKGNVELVDAINEIMEKAAQEGLFVQWYDEACTLADSLGIE